MIEVLSGGINTTIQDLGRYGFRKYGVPVSGAMDQYSALLANLLIGNPSECALLEFILQGPILKFEKSAVIAICGALFSPTLNNKTIELNHPIQVNPGDTLTIGRCSTGMYGYLSISSGFRAEEKFGSMSYYLGITGRSKINRNDQLSFNAKNNGPYNPSATIKANTLSQTESVISVMKGPEFDSLNAITKKNIFVSTLEISHEISRMGYRLNTSLKLDAQEIITAPVQPGTVQLTPSGNMIVLMRDAQTTGGYARILQLTEKGISNLVQKRIGESITFDLIY